MDECRGRVPGLDLLAEDYAEVVCVGLLDYGGDGVVEGGKHFGGELGGAWLVECSADVREIGTEWLTGQT